MFKRQGDMSIKKSSEVAIRLDPKDWNRNLEVAGGGSVFTGISSGEIENGEAVYLCVKVKDTPDDAVEWLKNAFMYRNYDYVREYLLEGSRISTAESDFTEGNAVDSPDIYVTSDSLEIGRTGDSEMLFMIIHNDGAVTGIEVYERNLQEIHRNPETKNIWKPVHNRFIVCTKSAE